LFVSGNAAFEMLSAQLQRFLAKLNVEHNFLKSFVQPRYHYKQIPSVGGDKKALWEVVVRTNPPPVVHPHQLHPRIAKPLRGR
jgi:alpha-ketoglutarate-dependent taurine dioxygenase